MVAAQRIQPGRTNLAGISLMINQPLAHAIIKLPKQKPEFVETPWIEEGYAREERVRETSKQKCYQLADFAHPKETIEIQIRERHQLLELKAVEFGAGIAASGRATTKTTRKKTLESNHLSKIYDHHPTTTETPLSPGKRNSASAAGAGC